MEKIENKKSEIRQPMLMAIAIAIGIFIGASFVKPSNSGGGLASNLEKFKEVLVSIDKNYVDEVSIEELTDKAIYEMLEELDPHSRYVLKEDAETMNARLQGSYGGIGIQFDILRDTVYVIKPIAGGPSLEAGLQIGDQIVAVEGENIAGIKIGNSGVTDRLLGEAGTKVNISILRDGKVLDFNLRRGQIPQKSVDSHYMIDDQTGYIKISRFGAKTYEEFVTAIEELQDAGMIQLVVDLQSNPGGRMTAAEKISDELIAGNKLVVSQQSVHKRYNRTFSAHKKGLFEEGPLIVLVNEQSASASEIVAGALQDHDRALIVGRRTFGKGLVQMPITLNDKSELMLTIARYYTPSGRSIQKPYTNGNGGEYYSDLSERFDKGEFFSADSIKFDDSLRFETGSGRIVYGGGGIMPDDFVPFDTTLNTGYYGHLVSARAVREFTLNYYLENEETINKMTLSEYQQDFKITDRMLAEVVKIGVELDVEFDQTAYERSLPLLKAYIKADIATFTFNENGYYSIMNPASNEIYIKALKLFEKATLLAQAIE